MIMFMLVSALVISFAGAVGNVQTKYSSAIVFTITLICITALIITGFIEI